MPSEQGNSQRRYKALAIDCVECGAEPWEPCITEREAVMRGVHRARDLTYNRHVATLGQPMPKGSRS